MKIDSSPVSSVVVAAGTAMLGLSLSGASVPPEAYAPDKYVQDGLLLHWDAVANSTNANGEVCHDTAADEWLPLKGDGFVWKLRTHIASWTDTGISCNGGGCAATMPGKTRSDFFRKLVTLEIVYKNAEKRHGIIFNPGFSQQAYVYTDTNGHVGFYGSMSSRYGFAVDCNVLHTYSVRYNITGDIPSGVITGYVDTVGAKNDSMNDYWSSGGGMSDPVLGGRTPDYGTNAKGTIHAIRIYSRTLTDDERATNYAIDRARFAGDPSLIRYVTCLPVAEQALLDGEAEICPEVVVSNMMTGAILHKGTDYTLSYADNTQAGMGTAYVTGINGYAGQDLSLPFAIVSLSGDDYRRNPMTHAVEVRCSAASSYCEVVPIESWTVRGELTTFALDTTDQQLDVTWGGAPVGCELLQGGRQIRFRVLETCDLTATVAHVQDLTAALVQKGLIKHFDAICNRANDLGEGRHDGSAATWRNLAGNESLPLTTMAAQGDYWTDKALVLKTSKSNFQFSPTGLPACFTVQFLIADTSGGTMIDSGDDNLWWQWRNAFKFRGSRTSPSWTWVADEPISFCSDMNWHGTCIATSAWHKVTSAATAFNSACYAGGYGSDASVANEKIRFIRVYDRLLTDSERRVNYLVDSLRYGSLTGPGAAVALGEDWDWSTDDDLLLAKVGVALSVGAGTITVDGNESAEEWIPVGNTVRLSFSPAAGLEFGAWSGLPDDAVVTDVTNVSFKVRGPVTVRVACDMPSVKSLSVRDVTSGEATLDYAFSAAQEKFYACFGTDSAQLTRTNEYRCGTASGSFVLTGFKRGVRCYVKIIFPVGDYYSSSETVSFVSSGLYFVTPGGSPENDGTSWAESVPFTNALALASENDKGCDIYVAGTNVVDIPTPLYPLSAPVNVYGGFTGGEHSLSERKDGVLSVLDGRHTGEVCRVSNTAELRFERLAFCRSYSHGLVKRGVGNMTIEDCLFLTNGVNPRTSADGYDGKGLSVLAGSSSRIVLRRCVFRGNRLDYENAGFLGAGGIYATGGARLTLEDCAFYGNGQHLKVANSQCGSANPGSSYFSGAAILSEMPVMATGCRFIGNTVGIDWAGGGIVRLNGGAGGSAFTNCVFAANQNMCNWGGNNYEGTCNWLGALVMQLNSQAARVDVANCTFAYNLACGWYTAAGITVSEGTVHVVNSIFGGNVLGKRALMPGCDIHVKTNATCEIEYSMLSGTSTNGAVGVRAGGIWRQGDGVLFGNPRFVTPPETVSNLVRYANNRYAYFLPGEETYATLESVDVHLRRRSPAIDAGNPTADYSREPTPNGRRVNLGAYGNTPWATISREGAVLIVR